MAFLILHIGNQFTQHVNRVSHGTTENTGMQVGIRTGYFNLPVSQTSQSRRDRRDIRTDHAGIGNQDHVCLQHIFMFPTKFRKIRRTDLFFTLDHEFHVTIQFPGFYQIFKSFRVHESLTFIIVSTTSPNLTVFYNRFERLGFPQINRVYRHHVHVTIY